MHFFVFIHLFLLSSGQQASKAGFYFSCRLRALLLSKFLVSKLLHLSLFESEVQVTGFLKCWFTWLTCECVMLMMCTHAHDMMNYI